MHARHAIGTTWTMLMLLVATAAPAAATHQDNCAGGNDAGNTFASATQLTSDIICSGAMNTIDPADWYYVDVPATQTSDSLIATVCPNPASTLDADIRLYFQPLGAVTETGPGAFQDSSVAGGQACDTVSATVTNTAGSGRWYIEITRFSGEGSYTLDVS